MKSILKFSTIALLSASSLSSFALPHKVGVITEVDSAKNVITVEHANGSRAQYQMASNTKIWLNGEPTAIESLAPNQEVKIKMPSVEVEYIEAEIVSLNLEQGLATVMPKGEQAAVTIAVNPETKISGKVRNSDQLAEGQTIKYRLADR